ncbi:hypothetical protein YZ82_01560 [Campylobacter hyointestinalis]|uniref:Uncharacterized protein n=1 Tax=Campylobacter hyointestinalis TaxID=198 RepID=A0A562XKM3_CAMHY|nr:hypothetical protein [Campylobacter hyointestinalis]TWO22630.1 hypothetical protein YZ82_01560 [Campylobacter hyointestinalis]
MTITKYKSKTIIPTTLEEAKSIAINTLNEKIDAIYTNYLTQYPEIEQASFTQKATEAFKVAKDSTLDLSETPYLTMLTGGENKELRNALATAVNEKVKFITNLEIFAVSKRDEIKAAKSIEVVEKIDTTIPSVG